MTQMDETVKHRRLREEILSVAKLINRIEKRLMLSHKRLRELLVTACK
jgi:hypothetical protein